MSEPQTRHTFATTVLILRRGLTILTAILGIVSIALLMLSQWHTSAPIVVGFFSCLALRLKMSRLYSGFAFTFVILAAVAASLYFPHWFVGVGDVEYKSLIVPLLMLIMFAMGTSLSINDFVRIAKMPKGVILGIVCQYSIMPAVGVSLAAASGLPAEIAAGIILVGCSPSGLASNVMAYISGANLALSLSLTAVSTLLAPFLTPLYMNMLAGQYVPIDGLAMFYSISKIVFLPLIAGLCFNHFLHGRFPRLDRAMPTLSMLSIAIIITIITAAGRDSLLAIGGVLIAVVLLHNLLGYTLGYYGVRLGGLDEASARTIAFEVGMQNSGLASGIALEMGKVATMGLAPAVFSPLMNITGSSLATWWRKHAQT